MPIDQTKFLRTEMIEHLEAALACADETQDGTAGYLIEQALDTVRAEHWPSLDPNLEKFRKGERYSLKGFHRAPGKTGRAALRGSSKSECLAASLKKGGAR